MCYPLHDCRGSHTGDCFAAGSASNANIIALMRVAKFLFSLFWAGGSMFAADLTDQYKSVADRLIDVALADNDGYACG